MAAFLHESFPIYDNSEFSDIKKLYSNLDKYINCLSNAEIHLDAGHSFSNFCGTSCDGIKWTWAMNSTGIGYFDNFLKSINFYKTIEPRMGKFHIRGASFITINESRVDNSYFHLDVMSRYNSFDPNTNIITAIFPLYQLEEDMGHLEYKKDGETYLYKYDIGEMLLWDSSKFEHRVQPYSLKKKRKRVMVSINLSNDQDWAKVALDSSTIHLGNLYSGK